MAGRAPLIVFLLVSCVAMAHAQTSLLTLAELERRALAANPTIAQAAAQVTATEARMAQAGRWANPSIGYTAEEVSNSVTIRGGEHGFFVEQVFPISGKLGATQAIFARVADQAVAIREAQRLRVINTVRTLYYEALIAARRVAVRNDLAALSDEAVDVSRRLANVGAADRTDLLASEIEAEQARLAVDDAEKRGTPHLAAPGTGDRRPDAWAAATCRRSRRESADLERRPGVGHAPSGEPRVGGRRGRRRARTG